MPCSRSFRRRFTRVAASCLILCSFLSLPARSSRAEAQEVTFNEDMAPLIHRRCTECHRPGEAAPFSLITYQNVTRRWKTMNRVIEDRYMPPWHPVPGHGDFADSRRLTDEELTLWRDWIAAGKPEGDPEKAPEPPHFAEGWQGGEPDLVVTMKVPYTVPADGPDIYRNFVLPLDLTEDKWVKSVELRPRARGVLHHSLYFLDTSGKARQRDGEDGEAGFSGMGFRAAGSLGGYVPGSTPRALPGDLAMALPKGADLILATHFHPSGKAEEELLTVGIRFADKEPARKLHEIQVPPVFGRGAGIDIPAGERGYTIEDSFILPVDSEAISVSGHAHYICSEMKMTATLPDGKEIPLLYIDDWDLDWQDRYFFKEPVFLPAGTVLKSVLIYDNSAENPNNPFDPPRRIQWGRESTDEMGSIALTVVPLEAQGTDALTRATRRNRVKVLAELGREIRDGRLLERLPRIIEGLDRNADGKLQKLEMPLRLRKRLFDRLDADDNGELSAEELETLEDFLENLTRPSKTA
ncbi:MAG: hypothetical protein ACC661_05250 [Verrucomicrobiales bacterium]